MSYLRIGDVTSPLSQAQKDALALQVRPQGAPQDDKGWLKAISTWFGVAQPGTPVTPPYVATAPVASSGTSIAVKLAIGAGVLGAAAYFIAKRK